MCYRNCMFEYSGDSIGDCRLSSYKVMKDFGVFPCDPEGPEDADIYQHMDEWLDIQQGIYEFYFNKEKYKERQMKIIFQKRMVQ